MQGRDFEAGVSQLSHQIRGQGQCQERGAQGVFCSISVAQYQPRAEPWGHNGEQKQTWPRASKGLVEEHMVIKESHNHKVRLRPPRKPRGANAAKI